MNQFKRIMYSCILLSLFNSLPAYATSQRYPDFMQRKPAIIQNINSYSNISSLQKLKIIWEYHPDIAIMKPFSLFLSFLYLFLAYFGELIFGTKFSGHFIHEKAILKPPKGYIYQKKKDNYLFPRWIIGFVPFLTLAIYLKILTNACILQKHGTNELIIKTSPNFIHIVPALLIMFVIPSFVMIFVTTDFNHDWKQI